MFSKFKGQWKFESNIFLWDLLLKSGKPRKSKKEVYFFSLFGYSKGYIHLNLLWCWDLHNCQPTITLLFKGHCLLMVHFYISSFIHLYPIFKFWFDLWIMTNVTRAYSVCAFKQIKVKLISRSLSSQKSMSRPKIKKLKKNHYIELLFVIRK